MAVAIALAVAAGPAAALGLGQLQVKSRPGQPLVAEIPIVSSDPAELEGLQVQLASPDTFSRVGLEPPQGVVSSLRFEPTLDASGHPVIRVTSAVPVETPLLTFLLQVDWSQGRLVREYSALLDTPDTVAATVQPSIEAPTVAPSNAIVRPPPIVPISIETSPSFATPTPPSAPALAVAPVAPVAPEPAPEAAPVPEAAPASAGPRQFGPVRAGQTLGQIAASVNPGGRQSAAQTMLALLRANPDAFIGGNVNRLKQGAVLTLPAADAIAAVDRSEAAALLHQQISQWRAAQPVRPQPQPQAVATAAAPDATHDTPKAQPASKPTRTIGARLEIAPPSAGSRQRAGTQSGIEAGGEGEMLRQQLQETKETLAARDAEVNELKARVTELEKLQQQQQQLLTMKDSALAAAQQTLAKSNAATAAPAPVASKPAATPAPVASTQAATPAPPQPQGSGFWLWGGLALLVAATVGWLLTRKRHRASAAPKRIFDTEALAASIPVARDVDATEQGVGLNAEYMPDQLIAPRPMQAPRTARVAVTEAVAPPWHGDVQSDTSPAAAAPPVSPNAQLAMAQACLTRGDDDAARVLLLEVMDGRDPAARDVAAHLLRDL